MKNPSALSTGRNQHGLQGVGCRVRGRGSCGVPNEGRGVFSGRSVDVQRSELGVQGSGLGFVEISGVSSRCPSPGAVGEAHSKTSPDTSVAREETSGQGRRNSQIGLQLIHKVS